MMLSSDPCYDWDVFCFHEQQIADLAPICDCCGEPIFDSHFYSIDEQKFCDSCIGKIIKRNFKVPYTDGLVCSRCGRLILEDESYQIEGKALCEDCIQDQVKENFLENFDV